MDIESLQRADRRLWKLKAEIGLAKKDLDDAGPGYRNALFHMEQHADRAIEYVADQLRLENA